MRRRAQHPDPAGVVLDHREHEHPRSGQGDRFEEVTGQEGLCLRAQEIGPCRGRAVGRRIDPCLPQDLPHGGWATFTPSTSSSPCSRRYPQPGFSLATRSTKRRIERTVRGRPGRLGRDRTACRLTIRLRCQRSTVSGRTSSLSPPVGRPNQCSARTANGLCDSWPNLSRHRPALTSALRTWRACTTMP
jgi:hypothetical protein